MRACLVRWLVCAFVLLAASACGGPKKEEAPPPPEVKAPAPQPPPPPAAPAPPGKIAWQPDLWQDPPKGLPPVPVPTDNPMSVEKVELGRKLYFDKRLSSDGTIACSSCHNPSQGFSNGVAFSPGVGGKLGSRNAPTVYNSAYSTTQFWDGRARSLEEQALGPIQNPVEMATNLPKMVATVSGIPEYAAEFQKVFGEGPVTETKVAMAIAAFERTILSGDAPYDRFKAGDKSALSPGAQRGLAVFEGKGRCVLCHLGPNFMDNQFHNLGVGTQAEKPDTGHMMLTKNEKDFGKFKTPTLRNVALTAPYMHDGSESTLEAVVELYDKGGIKNKNLDPLIQPLGLTPEEQADLVTFLKEGLTRELDVPVPEPVAPAGAPPATSEGQPMAPHGGGEAAPPAPAPPTPAPASPAPAAPAPETPPAGGRPPA
jgi:cytochrome c peroxidase